MPDYSQGKIYKLTCSETDKVYIGSTIQVLEERYWAHKAKDNHCITKDFINPKIELIQSYPCETREELLWKEREYQEKTECVNKCLPIRSKEERNSRSSMFYQRHKAKLLSHAGEKFTCECGGKYTRHHKSTHFKSKKHLNYVAGLNINR